MEVARQDLPFTTAQRKCGIKGSTTVQKWARQLETALAACRRRMT